MKRALLVLAALAWAAVASATVGLVTPSGKEMRTASLGSTVLVNGAIQTTLDMTLGTVARFNPAGISSLALCRPSSVRTTIARTGMLNGRQCTAVLWPGWRLNGSAVSIATPPGVCPESLTVAATNSTTLSNYTPTVPQVFIDGYPNECGFASNASYDTTGFNGEAFDPGHQGPGYAGGRTGVMGSDFWWQTPQGSAAGVGVWRNASGGTPADTSADAWTSTSGSTLPDGGWRTIIAQQASNWINSPFAGTPPAWRDSLYSPKDAARAMVSGWGNYQWNFPDGAYGMYVADQMNGHIAGAARNVYIHWAGFTTRDVGGITAYTDNRNIGDPILIPAGLAHVDSITNRDLFGANPNRVRGALVMRYVCRRIGGMMGAGGFVLSDSVGWKCGVDSLFALGFTITVGVCVDSMDSYPSELRYLMTKPNAVFAVERWNGTAYSFAAARAKLYAAILDYEGRPERAKARLSGMLLGSMRDVYGLAEAGVLRPQNADSIAAAIRAANFTCVSFDAEEDSSASMADSTAWRSVQRAIPCAGGGYLMAYTYPGCDRRGATIGHGRDSTEATYGSSHNGVNDSTFISHNYQRAIYGLFYSYWFPPIDYYRVKAGTNGGPFTRTATTRPWFGEPTLSGWSISPKANVMTGTNLICITSSSLGTGQYGTASPNMPGFYLAKYVRNALYAVNKLGGRTLCELISADQLTAKDIRR